MDRVVDKFIIQLEVQLGERQVMIALDDEARAWLSKKGFDPLFGARPLGRVIQEYVKKPLAEELLFGKLAKGGSVKVGLKEGKLEFDIAEAPSRVAGRPGSEEGGTEKEPEEVE